MPTCRKCVLRVVYNEHSENNSVFLEEIGSVVRAGFAGRYLVYIDNSPHRPPQQTANAIIIVKYK